ncbi:MAG: serine/threonine-protein phosphatase [Phycisphaerales bacterium]|nr:serine/threonine-protein phosphatase [Phycisphaerales bacterium]
MDALRTHAALGLSTKNLSVIFACCPSVGDDRARGFVEALTHETPAGVSPVWCLLSDLPVRSDTRQRIDNAAAAVLMISSRTDRGELFRAVAMLRESARATLIVRLDSVAQSNAEGAEEADTSAFARLAGDGVVCVTDRSPIAMLAGIFSGLLALSEPMKRMNVEIELATRAQHSAKAWIRRVDDELHTAAKMQRDLLPTTMPHQGIVTSAAVFRPLWHVSGDVYRVWRLDEHHLGFMLADAMGHGVRAAMATMILAHELILKHVSEEGYRLVEPREALMRLNRQMIEHPSEAMRLASAVCGVIDARSATLTIAAAGHPHPMLLTPGKSAETFELDGPVLGVFDEAEFVQRTIALKPRQSLVMYTDGAEDALAHATEHSSGMSPHVDKAVLMARALERCFTSHSDTLHDALHEFNEMLDSMPGSLHRADDVTLLALRREA